MVRGNRRRSEAMPERLIFFTSELKKDSSRAIILLATVVNRDQGGKKTL